VRVRFSLLGVMVLLMSLLSYWPPSAMPALAQENPPAGAADDIAIGVIVDTTNPRSMSLAREGGFTHAKMIVHWPRLEPRRGRYTFRETTENDLDNVMKAARAEGMKLVVRVDGTPGWAGGKPAKADTSAVEAFYTAMAAHGKGSIVAYEVLNEPNLPFEWGESPNPADYTQFLKAAYKGVKKGDPAALVIGGGLSPATGNAGGTIDDLDFLFGMYAAGAKGHMDALAVHNYGGNFEPEADPTGCGICFRRAELYRQQMVDRGDGNTPIWATEFGWLLDSGKNMGQYDWMRVSADRQAEYIVRAYQYAQTHWSWMTGLLLSNLDASTSPYHTGPQNGMPWFAILNKDHSPRPAWKAFKAWREREVTPVRSRPRPSISPQAQTAAASPSPATPEAAAVAAELTAMPSPTPEATVEQTAASATETPAPAATPGPTATPAPPATIPTRLRVTKTGGTGANLRERPGPDARVLAILMDETTVEVVGEDVKAGSVTWKQVRTTGSTSDGVTGWMSAQYLAP
jgi:hypothetical protein